MARQKTPKLTQTVPLSTDLEFPNLGRWFHSIGRLPGTEEDYELLAGQLWLNPVVQVGLRWLGDNACLPKLVLQRGKGKAKGKPKADHGLLDLWQTPNPYYGYPELIKAMAMSDEVDGNTYVLKVRDGNHVPRELYWLFSQHMTPVSEGGEYISYYEYLPPWRGTVQYFAPQDIIHIRSGLDPFDTRKGMSSLKAQAREVFSDNAASTYTAAILRNMGATAYIVSPKDPRVVANAEAKAKFKLDTSRATGDGAGNTIYSTNAVDVIKVGMSPEDMALHMIRRWPEDRILAAMGLNSTALNLTSGAGSKTFNNFGEAIRQCYEGALKPMLNRFGLAIQTQLLPDFGETDGLTLEWDYSGVSALREDQTMLVNRMLSLYTSGGIDRSELRSQLGYEVDEKRDKNFFYTGKSPLVPDRPEQEG